MSCTISSEIPYFDLFEMFNPFYLVVFVLFTNVHVFRYFKLSEISTLFIRYVVIVYHIIFNHLTSIILELLIWMKITHKGIWIFETNFSQNDQKIIQNTLFSDEKHTCNKINDFCFCVVLQIYESKLFQLLNLHIFIIRFLLLNDMFHGIESFYFWTML